jgi:hypothetical protein
MPLLEPHDELGLPWDDWADGKVYRLVRGRDFVRSVEALTEAAENAGRRLGRVARTIREVRRSTVIVWLQFVDYELVAGDPCGCGSTDLRRMNTSYARCAACGATSYIRPLKPKPAETVFAPSEDEALLLSSLSAAPAPNAKRAAPARLSAFTDLELCRYSQGPETERLGGLAVEQATGASCLVVVDYPLQEGGRGEAPGVYGGFVDRVWSLPTKLLLDLVRVDELARREPEIRIEGPLEETANGTRVGAPAGEDDLLTLNRLRNVTLVGRGMTATSERYVGYGVTPGGENVLLSLRYRLNDGARTPDPGDTQQPRHELRCVPVEPFAPFLELEELLSAPERIELEDGTQPPLGAAAAPGRRRHQREPQSTPRKQRGRKRRVDEGRRAD